MISPRARLNIAMSAVGVLILVVGIVAFVQALPDSAPPSSPVDSTLTLAPTPTLTVTPAPASTATGGGQAGGGGPQMIRVAGPTVTNLFPSYDRDLGQGLNCTTLQTRRGAYTGRVGKVSVVTTTDGPRLRLRSGGCGGQSCQGVDVYPELSCVVGVEVPDTPGQYAGAVVMELTTRCTGTDVEPCSSAAAYNPSEARPVVVAWRARLAMAGEVYPDEGTSPQPTESPTPAEEPSPSPATTPTTGAA